MLGENYPTTSKVCVSCEDVHVNGDGECCCCCRCCYFSVAKTMTSNKDPNTYAVVRCLDVCERALFDAVKILHKNELLDLIQIYGGAFYCVAHPTEKKKWQNKKHSQTNWRHHIMPFKSQTYSTFGVSVFFHSFISLLLWLLLSPLCTARSSRCLAKQMEKHITITATEWRWNGIQNNARTASARALDAGEYF